MIFFRKKKRHMSDAYANVGYIICFCVIKKTDTSYTSKGKRRGANLHKLGRIRTNNFGRICGFSSSSIKKTKMQGHK